jgi:hypothetical protein
MDNNTIDIDDESSECEELILKSRIIRDNYSDSDNDSVNKEKIEICNEEILDILDDDMVILEISLTPDDFTLLKENKIIIGDGEECILILNDLIKNCKNKEHNQDYKDKFKFIHGFIMGLIYSKYIKK